MAKNILICDDAAFMRMMIKDILTKNGYNIAGEAENGIVADNEDLETSKDLIDILIENNIPLDECKQIIVSSHWLKNSLINFPAFILTSPLIKNRPSPSTKDGKSLATFQF